MNFIKKLPVGILTHSFLVLALAFFIYPISVQAENTILKTFTEDSEDETGYFPQGGLLLNGGVLYGVNNRGGEDDYGTIYSINPDGTNYTVLHEFDGEEGARPFDSLITSGGKLFGVSRLSDEGLHDGIIYSINTDGTGYEVLHRFEVEDSEFPSSPLVLSGSVLYGVIDYGGTIDDNGSIYSINTDGTGYTVRHNFDGENGAIPRSVPIVVENKLYGTTVEGGEYDLGIIYSINPDGTNYTVLHEFDGEDGQYIGSPLIFSNGTLYGIVTKNDNYSVLFSLDTDGTGFDIVYELDSDSLFEPDSTLQGQGAVFSSFTLSGSKFYFTVSGAYDSGGIVSSNVDGSDMAVISTMASMVGKPNGSPTVSEGMLYGVTHTGSSANLGTIFSSDLVEDVAPWVVTFFPADDASGVGTDIYSFLSLLFNERVEWTYEPESVTLYRSLDDSIFFAQAGGGGSGTQALTIAFPTELEPETEYYVVIDEGSIVDLLGNPFAGIAYPGQWSFTTGAATPGTEEEEEVEDQPRRSSGSRRVYGCKDETAQNYTRFASHKQALCVYESVVPTASTTATPSIAIQPVRDLEFGMIGDDVLALQQLLNAHGFLLVNSGVGSVGSETTYFGALTRAALSKYQAANGIAPTAGYFGPITRTKMKTLNINGVWW